MKKLRYLNLSLFIGAIMLLTNCKKESLESTNTHINFEKLAVGQKSQYVRLESRNVWQNSDTAFKQTTDTLTLTVVSEDENGFKIAEEQLNKKIATFYYYFALKNDSLLVKPIPSALGISSVLFSFGKNSHTLKDNNLPVWTLNQWWRPKDLTITEAFGKTLDFTIFGKKYPDAFVYFNSQPVVADGPVIVRLYSKKEGFMSFQSLGGFAPFGSIYNLIPN